MKRLTWAGVVLKFNDESVISLETGEPAIVDFKVETIYDEPGRFIDPGVVPMHLAPLKTPVFAHFHLVAQRESGDFPVIKYRFELPPWYREK